MGYLVTIGTKKGLFTATSDDRRHWSVDGPHKLDADGFTAVAEIYAAAVDPRTGAVLVGAESPHFGPSVWRSDDRAATWTEPEAAPISFPEDLAYRPLDFSDTAGIDQPDSDKRNTLKRVWQLAFGPSEGIVWAGVEPTALFRSEDGGRTFTFNRPLWDHPEHTTWASGGGGPAVHTIVCDPADADHLVVAMSSGGIYETRDGGTTWAGITRGIPVPYGPDPDVASGHCIHKVGRDVDGVLYTQTHGRVYRRGAGQDGWTDISEGLPTEFGFSLRVHPTRAGTLTVFPVTADINRFPPDHRIQAWRSEDGGDTWARWGSGLPEDPYFGIVLRDATCVDNAADPGWYFGTRCGDVYTAADSDGVWRPVAQHLPDVLCVRAMEC